MIGIIGGYGDVGLYATKILDRELKEEIRVGGRNPDKVPNSIKKNFNKVKWVQVNLKDLNSIKKFINGCRLIINCTGEINSFSFRLAEISLSNGCQYIDITQNKKLKSIENIKKDVAVVYGVGSMPGLSGILPRYLAEKFDVVNSMKSYYTALGRFSQTAAKDYLEGVFSHDNKSMMLWKNGRIQPYEIVNPINKNLPFPIKKLNLFPYFDGEAEFVSKKLSLIQGEWYVGMDGEYTLETLEKARVTYLENKEKTILDLSISTELDCQGRELYAGFTIEIEGYINGEKKIKTLLLKCDNPSKLTGFVVSVTAIAILRGVFKGVCDFGKYSSIREFIDIMNKMNKTNKILKFEILDGSIDELFRKVEGEI